MIAPLPLPTALGGSIEGGGEGERGRPGGEEMKMLEKAKMFFM